jgi:4-amino-4-deoxy-L-arabinose transferase-like glycosyltransferase
MIVSALSRRAGLVIFAVALASRLIWVASLDNQLSWIDEQEFATVAEHIAHGDGYVSTSFRANPVLPYYLSVVFRVFGPQYTIARIGQAILGALTCVFIYRIGLVLTDPLTGVLSGLLLALYPPHIYLAGVLYVDCWLTFFCAVSVYLAALTLKTRGQLRLALLCGVSLGLTALTRAAFLPYIPCVCAAWMYGGRWGWRRNAQSCSVFLLGCALTILPWTIRNYQVYGRPMLISSGFYTMLWRGNNVLANGGADDRHLTWYNEIWRERLQQLPEDEQRALAAQYQLVNQSVEERFQQLGDMYLATDEVLKPLAIESLLSDPKRTATLVLRKVGTLFSAFSGTETKNSFTDWRNKWVAALSFYPVLVLGLAGAWIGLPRRRELALLYLLIVSVAASYVLLTVCTRFRLPLDPYFILFAALAMTHAAPAVVGEGWAASVRARFGVPAEWNTAVARAPAEQSGATRSVFVPEWRIRAAESEHRVAAASRSETDRKG